MNGGKWVARQSQSGKWLAVSRSLLAAIFGIALAGPAAGQESDDLIEELIVNATRLPRTIEDIAGTVSVIAADDMEREVAQDLDDLVRFLPGVSISTATRGGHEGFSIRGIGGNRVLTVLDGIRSNDIYDAGPSSYGRDNLDTDNIKTVELIRGPASALYGADAIGGAVILTSKAPGDYLEGDRAAFNLRASAADADAQYRGGFTAASQFGDVGLLAQYTHRQFAEQEVNGPGSLNPQDGRSDSLLLQLHWEVSPGQQLGFSMDNFVDEIETATGFRDRPVGIRLSGPGRHRTASRRHALRVASRAGVVRRRGTRFEPAGHRYDPIHRADAHELFVHQSTGSPHVSRRQRPQGIHL